MKKKFDLATLEKILKNDNTLKVVALLCATLLFLTVNSLGQPLWNNYFVTTEYVDSVPVYVEYDEEKYTVSGIPETIPVNIRGSENDVNAMMKQIDSLSGTLSLNYKSPGVYTVDTEQIKFNNTTPVTITPALSTFDVKIQQKVTAEKSIEVSYINGEGKDNGVMLKTPTLSANSTTITGGNEDVATVATVMGFVDLSTLDPADTTQDFTVKLLPYNAQGEVVTNVSLEPSEIQVSQPYEQSSVELPIEFEYINNNTDLYVSSICEVGIKDCSDAVTPTVKVYGDTEKISKMQTVKYKVDLSTITTNEGEVAATPVLDSGVYVIGDNEKKYNVTMEKGVTKTIENVVPVVSGLDPTLQAKALNSEDVAIDVTVTGAESVVNDLTAKDISLSLDLSEYNTPGQVTVPIKVKKTKNFDYELEKETITVELVEAE